MISISVNEFAKEYVETNKGEELQSIRMKLQAAATMKKNGAVCIICSSPI